MVDIFSCENKHSGYHGKCDRSFDELTKRTCLSLGCSGPRFGEIISQLPSIRAVFHGPDLFGNILVLYFSSNFLHTTKPPWRTMAMTYQTI